jgi:hypothetical protein
MPAIINNTPRKLAPLAMVLKPYVDDRQLLVEKAKEKLGAKAKSMHFFYGDKNLMERYTDEGYVETGFAHKGDPLLMRPDKMHKEHLASVATDSRAAAQVALQASDDKYKTRTADGAVVGPEAVDE